MLRSTYTAALCVANGTKGTTLKRHMLMSTVARLCSPSKTNTLLTLTVHKWNSRCEAPSLERRGMCASWFVEPCFVPTTPPFG